MIKPMNSIISPIIRTTTWITDRSWCQMKRRGKNKWLRYGSLMGRQLATNHNKKRLPKTKDQTDIMQVPLSCKYWLICNGCHKPKRSQTYKRNSKQPANQDNQRQPLNQERKIHHPNQRYPSYLWTLCEETTKYDYNRNAAIRQDNIPPIAI